jgi:hypothetical protein
MMQDGDNEDKKSGPDGGGESLSERHMRHRQEMFPMQNWRSWGSWYSWGSPVGLGLFLVEVALFVWILHLAGR